MKSGIDNRIICLNLKKVFTSMESAAYATQTRSKEVKNVCDHYSRFTSNNNRFMYYWEYCNREDTRNIIPQEIRDPVEIKWVDTEYSLIVQKRYNLKNYWIKPKIMYNAMKSFLDKENRWNTLVTIWEIQKIFQEHIRENINPSFSISVRAMAMHMDVYEKTYERILGLHEWEVWSPQAHRYVFAGKFDHCIPEDEIENIPEDQIQAVALRSSGIPVIDILTGTIYGTITRASDINKLNSEIVRWCCNGDIDSIFNEKGEEFKFRWVKYVR